MTESSPKNANESGGFSRLGHMVVALTLGISITGFLIGVGDRPEKNSEVAIVVPEIEISPNSPPQVVSYSDLGKTARGPNANWNKSIPAYQPNPTSFYGDTAATPEQRAVALAKRSDRRAFSGAPPVVPHAIDQRNSQACLVCHGEGLKVGDIVAPKMSHQFLTNCTQCHVESAQIFMPVATQGMPAKSSFIGLTEPGEGTRFGPGSPPTMPHPLWMRSECMSCHGDLGREGLRSSHPWRTNCVQCHAYDAELDHSPLVTPPFSIQSKEEEPVDRLKKVL